MPSKSRRLSARVGLAATAVSLAAALAVPMTTAPPADADPGDVVLEESFDETGLPDGWNPVVGDWSVQDGRLVGDTASIGRITFGPHLENYRLEATMRFESVSNSSRWAGVILDVDQDGSVPWWQAIMRSTSTASNGIEFAERTAGNTWNVPYTASAPYNAGVGRDIDVTFEVQGNRATWIFDGQRIMSGLVGRTSDGMLGFVHDGAVISIDDVRVTEIEPGSHVGDDGALPVTVAHRGYSAVNPENTLASYAAAIRAGAEFIEIDVHTTADGVPVVMHDQTVDRTTNGTGDVAELSSSYIETLEAGSWYSPAFSRQPAPTFAQMLELMRDSASKMLLEIKGPETSAEVKTMVDMVVEAGLEEQVVVQSFDTNALRYAREHAPQIERGLLRGSLDADPVAVAQDLGVGMYNPSVNALSSRPGIVADLNDAGIAVMPYTINSAAGWAQLTELGVDGIITDRAGAFIGWKQARSQAPEPNVEIIAPTDEVEIGDSVVIAATSTNASAVNMALDGEPIDNGTTLPAGSLGLGEHEVAASALDDGGEAETALTFSVIVTVDGLRGRLAALDVSAGQLQQLLTALENEAWADLESAISTHVTDQATADALIEQVQYVAE